MGAVVNVLTAVALVTGLFGASSAGAVANVSWANLTSDDGSSTVYGSIATVSGAVDITYSGGYAFDQINGAGTDY